MFRIYDYDIFMTRGDTGIFNFSLCECGSPEDTDVYPVTAVLSVKKKASDKTYLLQKNVDDDGLFIFESHDTENIPPGKYIYDIELRSRDQVATMGPYRFTVLPDVTRKDVIQDDC